MKKVRKAQLEKTASRQLIPMKVNKMADGDNQTDYKRRASDLLIDDGDIMTREAEKLGN